LDTLYGEIGAGGFTPADATAPRSAFVIAWLDDEPVGCGALRPLEDGKVAEIKRMYVRPSARGQGISRSILTKLEALALEFEYPVARLETGVYQPAAIGLYEASGYTRIVCYGEHADELSVCFEKRLADQ
jgi:GNAT superfamily N-acetyltransferase